MIDRPCPRCGPDGDVAVSATGVAACRICQGGFVSMHVLVPALIAAGVTPMQLKDLVAKDGRKLRPCPTCVNLLTTFVVRRETLHACTPCSAMWVDDGTLLRLGGIDPAKLHAEAARTAPPPAPVLETSSSTLPAAGAIAPARPMAPSFDARDAAERGGASGLDLDGPARGRGGLAARGRTAVASAASSAGTSNPLGDFAATDLPDIGDAPFRASIGGFSERSRSGTSLVGLALKLGIAAMFLGGMYFVVTTAFMKGEPTPIGGGYQAMFWRQPIKSEAAEVNGTPVKRMVSPWGTNTLEAVFIPGGGGNDVAKNGKPESAVGTFHGRWLKMVGSPTGVDATVFYVELEFIDERDANKSNKDVGGVCRYYYDERDGWLLCGYSDSNLFPRSGKAMSFVGSLAKTGKNPNEARIKSAAGVVEVD